MIPTRRMLDGTPCWCVSSDDPHAGWIHAPMCIARRRSFPFDPDPLYVEAPDSPAVERSGMACVWVAGALLLVALLVMTLLLIASRPPAGG